MTEPAEPHRVPVALASAYRTLMRWKLAVD
jgi:hypothetical protein